MKKSMVRLFVFLLPMLLVWAGLEFFYRNVPNNYTKKYAYVNKHASEIETLLFGTSHCFYGLNPEYFSENTFNFSNISQSLYFDTLLFENYVSKMPNLKQVVFCIEYTNLSQRDNTDEDTYRKYYYAHYMNLDVSIVSDLDPKKYSLAFTRNLEQSFRILKKYAVTGSIVDCDDNGWGNDYRKENRISPTEVAQQRAKNHEDGSSDFTINIRRLQKVIAICKKRNIEVVIVSLPQTKAYTQYLNHKKLEKIFATCNEFQLQNSNVRYLNLFKDDRFVDEDFYDADHLNNVGAVKVSKIVNAFLGSKK